MQNVQAALGRMFTWVESSRAVVYHALNLLAEGLVDSSAETTAPSE